DHPSIAAAIQWQFRPSTDPTYGIYDPLQIDKIGWADWSASQKADLVNAFAAAYNWYFLNPTAGDSIPIIPTNLVPSNYPSDNAPVCYIPPAPIPIKGPLSKTCFSGAGII